MDNEGINRLARILDRRTEYQTDKPPVLDFGEIQNDMSLLSNHFPRPIPTGDYIVCKNAEISPKSRVFIAWVGDDAVVIDTI